MSKLHAVVAIAMLALQPAGHADEPSKSDADETPRTKGPRGAVVVDPMQDLRDRLAAKLNATKTSEGKGEQGLRVSTQADGEIQLAPAARPAPALRAAASKRAAPKPAAKPQGHGSAHWSYDGDAGPHAWHQLKPEYVKCGSGTRQSPIDIRDGIRVDMDPVQFDYRAGTFRVLDNGHTVQAHVAAGNFIDVMGRRYELQQFHFHRPSEERIDGKQFDMVVHLVHKDLEGRLAVVAVLLERGAAHAVVQSVWNNLPLEKNEELAARTPLDPSQLLPKDPRYFAYMGSLTTPPCSEGVLWIVMQQPVPVSAEQIEVFARLYPMNARPLQQASGRLIKQSN
ncbi:MAG: carbonic anhydrase family protein [Burkholderiaceae bacterium]|nr:carbonic anhydrase family protein [Burkholderiaceae bacterium]